MNNVYAGDAQNRGNPPFTNKEIESLYAQHLSAVRNVAAFYLRNQTAIADAAQETFLRAMSKGATCDRRYVKNWLCRICANYCKDRLRYGAVRAKRAYRRRPREGDPAQLVQSADQPVLDALVNAETDDRVRRALYNVYRREASGGRPRNDMGRHHLQALLLFHVLGMKTADMSKHLGVPEGTVKTWLRRARPQFIEEYRKLEEAG